MKSQIFALLLSLNLLFAATAHAARPTVTVNPNGNGKFSVLGSSMDGVAGIDISISYDSSVLMTPTVTQGTLVSGAMMAANAGFPGLIKVAIVSTSGFKGSGEILSIAFNGQSGTGGVNSITAKMIDANGTAVAATATISSAEGDQKIGDFNSSPGIPFRANQQATEQLASMPAKAQSSGSGASTSLVPLGTLTLTADSSPTAQVSIEPEKEYIEPAKSPEIQTMVPESNQVAIASPLPQKTEVMKHSVVTGVLERFRMYRGERSPQILAALFAKQLSVVFTQSPDIAVSDGSTVVTVKADLTGMPDVGAPNFALSEAKLVSLKMDDNPGVWMIEFIPTKNSVRVTLTVLAGSTITEVPITTVPLVNGLLFTDSEATLFFQDSGTLKSKYDLNADAKHDFIDDFIYTGHFILQKNKQNQLDKGKPHA